jgi:hypothetical protein
MPLRANCAILAGQLGSAYFGFTMAIRPTYTVHGMVFASLAEVFIGDFILLILRMAGKRG